MKDEKRYIHNPNVSCRPEEPEGAILYDPVEDAIEIVNMTGLAIWRLVRNRTIAEIVTDMLVLYDGVSREQLLKDVSEFVVHLADKKFVLEEKA